MSDLGYDSVVITGGNTLALGEDIIVTVGATNSGSELLTARTKYYWSSDDTFDEDDSWLVKDLHGDIDAGESVSGEAVTIKWDDLAGYGDGYLIAVLFDTSGDDHVQHDVEVIDFSFAGGATVYKPDFYYDDISTTMTAATLAVDEALVVTVSVGNQGLADARTETTFYWSDDSTLDDDDTLLHTLSHGSLASGELADSEVETISYTRILREIEANNTVDLSTDNEGFLFAVVDAGDEEDESNESNNTTSTAMTIEVLSGPDLSTNTVTVSDATFDVGDSVDVSFKLQNSGDEGASARGAVYWSSDGTFDAGSDIQLDNEGIGILAAGATSDALDFVIDYDDVEDLGSGFLLMVADPRDRIDESNEGNNVSSTAITVNGRVGVDMEYDSVAITGGNTLALGSGVTITAAGTNNGDTDGRARTKYFWSEDAVLDDDDIFLDRDTHGALNAGASFTGETVTLNFDDVVAGIDGDDGYILAVLYDTSGDGHVVQDTEALDISFAGGATSFKAELEIDSLTTDMTADTLGVGDALDIDLTVSNNGLEDARAKTTFLWSADSTLDAGDTVIGVDNHKKLAAGETDATQGKTLSYNKIIDKLDAAGVDLDADNDGFLFAVIDYTESVDEIDENNNTESVRMVIETPAGPDLTIDALAVSTTAMDSGDEVAVTVTVSNGGDEDVKAQTRFYWSTDEDYDDGVDTFLGLDKHGTLDGGETKIGQGMSFDYDDLSAFSGTSGYIIGVIEVNGTEVETDTGNNDIASDEITIA